MLVKAIGVRAPGLALEPINISRREIGLNDVQIDIIYCGISDLDLFCVLGESSSTKYPCVPGQEIVGIVSGVGTKVSTFKVGDVVGVGQLIDSCRDCDECIAGRQEECGKLINTYNSLATDNSGHTHGGYSKRIVVRDRYVLRIQHLDPDLAAVAPLLGAGISAYSPLRQFKAGPGKKVGVVSVKAIGHLSIKIAKAMGANVIAIVHAESERADAYTLGADDVILSGDVKAMNEYSDALDLVLHTTTALQEIDPYLKLLKRDGTLAVAGSSQDPLQLHDALSLSTKRRTIVWSGGAGLSETQEMLEFCAEHGIVADVETVKADEINIAYERMLIGGVKHCFVLDARSI